MIPELPPNPRAELEARVTAWLLGELSADDAARVRAQIEKDPELAKLRDRLSQTLNLLRETVATPVGETPATPAPLKLSAARREKLLAQFKTIKPKEFAEAKRPKVSLAFLLTMAASIMILAALLMPALSRAKRSVFGFHLMETAGIESAKSTSSADEFVITSGRPSPPANVPVPTKDANLGVDNPTSKDKEALFALRERRLAEKAPAAPTPPAAKIVLPQSGEGQPVDADRLSDIKKFEREDLNRNGRFESLALPPPVVTAAPAPSPSGIQAGGTFTYSYDTGVNASPSNGGLAGYVQTASGVPAVNSTLGLDKPGIGGGGGTAPTFSGKPNDQVRLYAGVPAAQTPATANPTGQFPSGISDVSASAPVPTHGGQRMVQKEFEPNGNTLAFPFAAHRKPSLTPIPPSQAAEPPAPGVAVPGEANANVNSIELPAPVQPKVIPLKYAQASEVAEALKELGASGGTSIGHSSSGSNLHLSGDIGQTPATAALAQRAVASTNEIYSVQAVGYVNVQSTNMISLPLISNTTPMQLAKAGKDELRLNNDGSIDMTFNNGVPSQDLPYTGALFRSQGETVDKLDRPVDHPVIPVPVPQPEVLTRDNAFTTFSLNISDVAFKLAEASLQNGRMPEAASMRSEEFINAFDYRDAEPPPGAPIGFAWERAGDPFAHNRDFVRFSIHTAAQGRAEGCPLNLVLLLDKSGSMERADRVEIVARALNVLASQLHPNDTLSVVIFARQPRLFADGVPGNQAGTIAKRLRDINPEGGTNLEEAMKAAYQAALRHYLANGENRVVLMTDGAANLGNVDPAALKRSVEANRKQGIAFDCFGVGWDGYNDNLLETLSRAGNGRYGFVNTPEEAATEFAGKLAGALRVAAADVKVQVEFNPRRVTAYRQIGYAKDQLKKEDFRNNAVKAAQIGAAEAGNALYTVQINPTGEGPLGTVHVRYRVPGTENYEEHEWALSYTGGAIPLDSASPAMRLIATSAAFAEWLAGSPYAAEVTPDRLLQYLRGVPQVYGADNRPAKLEWMIRQAKSISGK